ncbi:MAG: hypothetical protein ABIU95_09090, partial [Burkholderiales bacterium]
MSLTWWANPVALTIAGLAAAVFLGCQAKILHMARGIPAWRVARMPVMIVASGLLEGLGLLAITQGGAFSDRARLVVAIVALVLIALNAWLWRAYVSSAKLEGIGPLPRKVLERATVPLHIVGHALPAINLLVVLVAPATAGALLPLAGLAAIAGGAFWKFTVIVRASYQQGFALSKMPKRGSGTRAAPARLDGV